MDARLAHLPARIVTPRLVLRPYRPGDGPAYFAACRANQTHLLPFEAGNPALDVQTVADAERLVRRFAAEWRTRSVFFLGAWARDTDNWVAQIYVGVVNWTLPEFEAGYWVDAAHEGQGFVSEALRGALGMVFGAMGATRVSLHCNDLNGRSARVAERCGFTLEGHLRENNPAVRTTDGRPSGELIYGLLRAEYVPSAR